MTVGGPVCSMPDRPPGHAHVQRLADGAVSFSGFHHLVYAPWGAACAKCSKTWEWVGKELVPTRNEP